MHRFIVSFMVLAAAGSAFAQSPPASPAASQPPSTYYPAPPPLQAPQVEQGVPLKGLSSPLGDGQPKLTRTVIDSEVEAQLFASAVKIV
ncbi:MAG: hypothetical protein ACHQK9_04650, partial [Reyranellales bacterium]